jgi:hypothetical protein
MLDKSKLFKQIKSLSDRIFFDISNELEIAVKTWNIICSDSTFAFKLQKINSPCLIPKWTGELSFKKKIEPCELDYQIIGVDGSQVYPDRHQGTACFLINTGAVKFEYLKRSKVTLFSEPNIFVESDLDDSNLNDYVDCLREEFEFNLGANLAISDSSTLDFQLLIFDGSLIFWHLMSKDHSLKKFFLPKYLKAFNRLYQKQYLYCSYISLPNNKELINLIRMKLFNFELDKYSTKVVDKISDSDLMGIILDKNERSIVFENQAQIVQEYPSELKPHFFYLNVGNEVVRVEIPKWIADDDKKIEVVERVVLDQCLKGGGYPVVLAEAHEQAVIKSADRYFFYELLNKTGLNRKFGLNMSIKAAKKRKMPI